MTKKGINHQNSSSPVQSDKRNEDETNRRLKGLLTAQDHNFITDLQTEQGGLQTLVSKRSEIHFALLVQVVTRLCSQSLHRKFELNAIGLLEVLMASDFLRHLTSYLTAKAAKSPDDCLPLFSNAVLIFRKVFDCFPPDSTDVLGPNIRKTIEVIRTVQRSSYDIKYGHDLIGQLTQLTSLAPRRIVGKLRHPVGGGLTREEWNNATAPQNNFRHIPVTISHADVHQKVNPILYPNIVCGQYESVEHYLDVQFRLFREDFVGPMREAITQYIEQVAKNETKIKLDGVNVYNSVYIGDVCIGRTSGIIHKLHFNAGRLYNVDWNSTRRLLFGSLVCLSSDNFSNFTVAVVADSCPKDLARGYVYVKFLDANYGGFSKSFVMIESPTYYEAYAPVLRGLKQIDEVSLPFQDNLINVSTEIQPPKYLKHSTVYSTKGWSKNHDPKFVSWSPLRSSTWPSAEQLNLDESQNKALKAALTREIAIIQGPPATGKTYVGLKVVEVLLENDCGQILIVCYTNHALDQFLEGILEFCPKGVVRVGGQSKSELLSDFNLNRKMVPKPVYVKILEYEAVVKSKIRRAKARMAPHRKFLHFDFENRIIPEWLLIELDVISDEHAMQLEEAMYEGDPQWNNALDIWLKGEEYRVLNSNSVNSSNKTDEQTPPTNISNTAEHAVDDVLANEERARRVQNDEDEEDMYFIGVDEAQEVMNSSDSGYTEEISEAFKKISQVEREKIRKKIRLELQRAHYMHENDAQRVQDIWKLKLKNRWSLYRLWLSRAKEKCKKMLLQLQTYSERQWEMFWEFKQECSLCKFQDAKVIGMTTSGAARHRRNLQKLQPPILIVEEAAEVLEAHVISALTPTCQHLILIGDQQQLRPKPSVYELEKDYHLDVSLFERLINNGLPYERLQLQHRMRPEISNLLVPNIYPDLLDHPVVKKYKNIAGMKTNVYFFDHKNEESKVADSKSKSNCFEAELLIGLCQYLTNQGYEPCQMTVLTGYNGQVALLQNNLPEGVRCTSIDGYQGEENDIILLSLVRSNTKGAVGFLKVENRVCVALSRAKMGLYCVGNFDLLSTNTEVWKPIVEKLSEADLIGPCFSLVCQNHPETVTEITSVGDFNQVYYGGCSQPCTVQLQCGHNCPLTCHILDSKHENIGCMEICFKPICQYGHKCHKQCGFECGICDALVLKQFPCGHENVVPCNVEPTSINCLTMGLIQLKCGHTAEILCGFDIKDFQCQEMVEHTLQCGHQAQMYCCTDKTKYECRILVSTQLMCSHFQMVPCSLNPLTFSCKQQCIRRLKCGHEVNTTCSQSLDNILCLEKCEKILKCGHRCQLRCKIVCDVSRCIVEVEEKSQCGHMVMLPCNDRKNGNKYCKYPCITELPCGHACKGSCSACYQGRIHVSCHAKCSTTLLSGVKCPNICSRVCSMRHSVQQQRCGHGVNSASTPCNKPCNWHCDHKFCTKKCDEMCDRDPCDEPCPLKLECGHSCLGYCGEPCPQFCLVCSQSQFINKFVIGFKKNNKKLRYVLLEDCDHVIERGAMDSWMKMKQSSEGDEIISLKTCPKCNAVITSNLRYGNMIRTAQNDVAAVKREIYAFSAHLKRNIRSILNSITDNLPQLDNCLPIFSQRLFRLTNTQDLNTFDITFLRNANALVKKISGIYNRTQATLKTIQGQLMSDKITTKIYQSQYQNIELIRKHLQDLEPVLVSMVDKRSGSNVMWPDLSRDLMRVEYMEKIVLIEKKNDNTANDQYSRMVSIVKTTTSPFDVDQEEKLKNLLNEWMTNKGGCRVIVQQMSFLTVTGFVKGRWLKCGRDGHIYETKDDQRNCPRCNRVSKEDSNK